MSVNLSEYCSHPGYPYERHITNIADSFDIPLHKEIALFHDIGKLSSQFQNGVLNGSTRTTHALEGAFVYFAECIQKKKPIGLNELTAFWIIASHHTGLVDYHDFWINRCADYAALVYDLHDFEKNFEQVMERAYGFSKAGARNICECFEERKEQISGVLKAFKNFFFIREAFSRLIFADRYEAIFKEAFQESESLNVEFHIQKLKSVFDEFSTKGGTLNECRNSFRETVLSNYCGNKDKYFYIVEAPTGIGKTLAALDLALQIAKDKKKKRIITALPMTSIIDQTHRTYCSILGDDSVLKDHYLADTKNYADHVDIQKNDFLMNSWASDEFIVTTFNRLLNAVFSSGNSDLFKFWTLRNSVVILDEIQSFPRVLLQDIAQILKELAVLMDIDFIVMSATVPEIKRFLDSEKTVELSNDCFFQNVNNRYFLQFDESTTDIESLTDKIVCAYGNNQSVLCVVNTKASALKVYERLKNLFNSRLFLLSGYFLPCERKRKLMEIQEALQKEKIVLVSTQVVEAGVDLDFDRGFRELAPFSSIIQAAGRVNREGSKKTAEVTVFPLLSRGPYHPTDMLVDKVIPWLKAGYSEHEIVKKYFKEIVERSDPDPRLIKDIEELNYKTVWSNFRKIFMSEMPFYVKVFLEIQEGLYEQFDIERKTLLSGLKKSDDLAEKMSYKVRLKKLMNELSSYIINVSKSDVASLGNMWDLDDLYLCMHDQLNDYYDINEGWRVLDSSSEIF